MKNPNLKPEYSDSYALIIGINKFKLASPLSYAVSDAEAVRDTLINNFKFPSENMTILSDEKATRANVMSAYMTHVGEGTKINDRLVVFFAGHGMTSTGSRGEVGFLVPYDGNPEDLSSLIRWDEFTFNAELITAKHILFIMDACYGGLALSRGFTTGSMRFLKDMLLRPVRQVLTAGKADQTVADSGGPRPKHSVFTSHLLDGLDGQAAAEDGVITANGVMSYVYDKVSKDIHSHQTPHFGFFDGDGDLIFSAPIIDTLTKDDKVDNDVLITIPAVEVPESVDQEKEPIDLIKEYLSDTKYTIKLHDLTIQHCRRVLIETSDEKFPVQGIPFSVEEFITRLDRYEEIIRDIKQLTSCISYWGSEAQRTILQKAVGRITDNLQSQSGLVSWLALRWYPIIVLTYAAGIAAISAQKYDNLFSLFTAQTSSRRSSNEHPDLLLSIGEAIVELERTEVFKQLPGHERNYVPRSEYLFKLLQPDLDNLFFLGREYEHAFDRFEVILALTHADLRNQKGGPVWGPIGKFGWKYENRGRTENPLIDVIEEATEQGSSWPLLQAGFFGNDIERFKDVSSQYTERIKRLGWW